jgi:hypothetical protein
MQSRLRWPERGRRSALDLDEFGRLLCSGDPADLKRIASDFSSADPASVWHQMQERVAIEGDLIAPRATQWR